MPGETLNLPSPLPSKLWPAHQSHLNYQSNQIQHRLSSPSWASSDSRNREWKCEGSDSWKFRIGIRFWFRSKIEKDYSHVDILQPECLCAMYVFASDGSRYVYRIHISRSVAGSCKPSVNRSQITVVSNRCSASTTPGMFAIQDIPSSSLEYLPWIHLSLASQTCALGRQQSISNPCQRHTERAA